MSKVKGKDKLWEFSGRMKGLVELRCGLPGSVKHRARVWGINTGFGCGVWERKRGHPAATGCFQLQSLCWPLSLLCPRLSSGSVSYR